MNVLTVIAAALVLSGLAFAQANAGEDLPPGTPLLGADALEKMALSGSGAERETSRVEVTGQSFKRALRVRTKLRPASPYNIQLTAPSAAPVRKGDVILARFWARAVESPAETGEAVTEFVFERLGQPWTKSSTYRVNAGAEWKRYDIPFTAAESYAPGQAHVCLRLGYDPQAIELAAFELTGFGTRVKLSDLPVTVPTYRGQEPGAKWRAAARERIERHRKGDITVTVTDAASGPVAGAAVSVRMRRHAYGFGSAVNSRFLQSAPEGADKKKYREIILERFNRVVLENGLKWPRWESRPKWAVDTVNWLRAGGLEVRGHCLVWPSWRHVPDEIRKLEGDPAALRKAALDHVRDEASAMRGKLVEWDVINEPFSNHDLMDVLGPECMVDWFKAAREADPDARLYINDYAILAGGGGDSVHRRHYEKTIRFLIDKGAPLDGIGVQCHFGSTITAPEDMLRTLDRFAKFKLPIEVTEFDLKTGIEKLEADYTRDFMTAVFSHPSTVGILMWGFWDGRHWKGNAPLYRRDWSLKPSGEAWIDLVSKEWWTDEEGTTGRAGEFRCRGFLGDYEVTVEHGGRKKTAKLSLAKGGAKAAVVLE